LKRGRSQALASAAPIGLLGLIGALYLWELVTMWGVPFARDMQMFFIPQKHLLWEALQDGRVPLWTPHIGTGAPLLANFQSGAFYPPDWLYAVMPFFPAFNLLVVFHFLLGGFGAYLLARKVKMAPTPAFATAVALMLGGYFASLLNLINALQGAAWAPAVCYVVLDHLERRSVASLLRLILVTTLALLAGEPQSFLLTLAAATVVGVLGLSRDERLRRRTPTLLLSTSIAVLFVTGLAMIQVLPTLEYIQESGRAGGGLIYGEASAYSLSPIRLLHLIVPADYSDPVYSFGIRSTISRTDPWLFSVYLGALCAPLIYFAWRNRDRRREVAAWTLIGALGVVIALGGHTPVYRWLFDHFPGFSMFRFPEKYFFFTGLAAAFLTGYGVEELLEGRRRRLEGLIGGLLLAVLVTARVMFHFSRSAIETYVARFNNDRMMSDFDFPFRIWGENLTKLVLVMAIGFLLIWLYRRATISRAVFGVLFVTLITADLLVAHRDLTPVVDRSFYEATPLLAEHLPLDEVQRDYRFRATGFAEQPNRTRMARGVALDAQKWMWQQTFQPNTGQLRGLLQPDHWDAMKPRRYRDKWDFYRILPEAFRRWNLLRLNSVKYVYSLEGLAHEGYAREIALDSLPGRLYELIDPLPRSYVVPNAVYFADEVAMLNAMLLPGFDPHVQVTLLDPSRRPSESPETPADTDLDTDSGALSSSIFPETSSSISERRVLPARFVTDEPEEVRLRVDAEAPGFLVLTDSYYPGWHAFVDDEEREIRLANFFFRAVELRPGDREVVFRYLPPAYRRGRVISLLTLLLGGSALLVCVLLRRRRRAPG
jgi:hypothetical protein